MKEHGSEREQAKELAALRTSVEALMSRANGASPEEVRKIKSVIDGLVTEKPRASARGEGERRETSTIQDYVDRWNRGESFESGIRSPRNCVWLVYLDGKIFAFPEPQQEYSLIQSSYFFPLMNGQIIPDGDELSGYRLIRPMVMKTSPQDPEKGLTPQEAHRYIEMWKNESLGLFAPQKDEEGAGRFERK